MIKTKMIFVAVRKSLFQTETRNQEEEFLDFNSFDESIQGSLDKSRSHAKLLSTPQFDVEALQPIVRITRVVIEEV